MTLREAVREARFGPVMRVHRRYPGWEQVQLSLYGLALLFFVAVVPVFALWLNHWRFMPGVLFVVGSIAAAVIAAPWYYAVTRGERYAVTELGVLVWSPRAEPPQAIRFTHVVRVKKNEVTWNDDEGQRRYLTVRPAIGRYELLAAFAGRAPVPARPASRFGPPLVAALLVLPTVGALLWWGAVPTAVELIRGERPEDVFALDRVCDDGDAFRGSAPYRGQGPHPILVIGEYNHRVIGVSTTGRNWPDGHVIQLVACGRKIGRIGTYALASCPYTSTDGGGGYLVNYYQGRFEYDVREARTGRRVGSVTVDGESETNCESRQIFGANSPRTEEIDLPPTSAQLDTAFAALVNGPAPA
jgi:hypothetical protein